MARRSAYFVAPAVHLLVAGQTRGHGHHLAIEKRDAQLEPVGHGHAIGLHEDVSGQPHVDVDQLHGGHRVESFVLRLAMEGS